MNFEVSQISRAALLYIIRTITTGKLYESNRIPRHRSMLGLLEARGNLADGLPRGGHVETERGTI